MYKLVYIVGKAEATIIASAPKPVCYAKRKQLKASPNYQLGKFEIRLVN